MKVELLIKKLKKVDNGEYDYFKEDYFFEVKRSKEWTSEEIAFHLATFIYDTDNKNFCPETWDILERVKKHFGRDMKDIVIEFLCKRKHDT
jgi:hypothetical protein